MERELQRRILEAEEKEKRKLAEDLHDGLGPLLSTVKIYLNMLDDVKRPESEQHKLIQETRDIIDEAVKSTRDLSHLLMPNILRDYGLARASESFLTRVNPDKKLNISFNSNISEKRLGTSLETILYRTLTELVNNTLKHSDAQHISISILESDDVIELVYVDDGKGFESDVVADKGQGLTTIRSRIHAIGGEIMVSSAPGKGIRVTVTLHLEYLNIAND
jgi:signal transduction histidine kinase